jgi:serine/threonine protein kinase
MPSGESGKLAPRAVGRYLVYGEIASGGMATVHYGRLTALAGFARSVAIKRLHAHFAKDPEFVKMFLDEARLAARVTHPNVVATLDVVALEDELFLVMDYVRGASLAQLLRMSRQLGQPVPPLMATGIVAGALHGLHAAHEAKSETGERLDIVHRDVSPQNVLVGTDGVARVLDFGVAKAAGRMQETRDGQLKGKLSYMAPEQIQGVAVTRRTDVYAASVVLWEALTGERLFKGENEGSVLAKVLGAAVPPPSSITTTLPAALDRVVMRGLQRDPAERFATAREMAQELEAVFGVASAAEIGDWVERVASGELEARARRIAEMEKGRAEDDAETSIRTVASPGLGAPDAPTPVGRREPEEVTLRKPSIPDAIPVSTKEVPSQVSSVSLAHPTAPPFEPARSSRRTWIVAGAVASVAVLALLVLGVASLRRTDSPGPSTATATTPSVEAPVSQPSSSTAPAPADVPPASSAPVDEPTASAAPPAPSTAPASSAVRAAQHAAPAAPPAVRPTRSRDCNPPFSTGPDGHVHFKPQCM